MSDKIEFLSGLEIGEARTALEARGWSLLARGDWASVYAKRRGRRVIRLAPIDWAHRMFIEDCLAGPPSPWLPRLLGFAPLAREGYAVAMERLRPVSEVKAKALTEAMASKDAEPSLAALKARLQSLSDAGAARYKLWGGLDTNPRNVMIDAQGQLKLIDPVYLTGLKVVEALQQGRSNDLAAFSRSQLIDFLTIPAFDGGEGVEALRQAVEATYAAL